MLVPKPAQSQQHNVHSSDAHAEDDCCIALASNSRLTEVDIHNAHGHQVEEEVPPVQVGFSLGGVGVCLEGGMSACGACQRDRDTGQLLCDVGTHELAHVVCMNTNHKNMKFLGPE